MKLNKSNRIFLLGALLALFFNFNLSLIFASEISKSNIINLVNDSRVKNNLSILKESALLDAVAKDKVKDMIENNYFAHTSPSGKDPWYWFKKNGYQYASAGENLAINFENAEDQHREWMNSPTHRKNILNSKFSEIGVAVAKGKIDGEETIVVAQVFAAPFFPVSEKAEPEKIAEAPKVLPAETVALPKAEEVKKENVSAETPIVQKEERKIFLASGPIVFLVAFIFFVLFAVIGFLAEREKEKIFLAAWILAESVNQGISLKVKYQDSS